MRAPSGIINFGVNIGGRHANGAAYIALLFSTKFEHLGGAPTEFRSFRARAGERIDQTLACFEKARFEAETAGFN
eukprot:17715-Pyramimonas_sp.AAC.1